MSTKARIVFVLPEGLQKELKEQLTKDGYDLKAKSRWISEALLNLFTMKNYPDLVKLSDEMSGFKKSESVLIDANVKSTINKAVLNIRKKYPTIEGVQSRIMRTAIIQRLLCGCSVTEFQSN